MMGPKNMKQETMAKRIRNRAMDQKMAAPKKSTGMAMPPDMGMSPAPQMMPPAGMKKGGMAKKDYVRSSSMTKEINIKGTGKTKAAAEANYAKKMKASGLKPIKYGKGVTAKKGGMMLIIGLGKKKGK